MLKTYNIKGSWLPSIFISIGIFFGFFNALNPSPMKLIVCVVCAFFSLILSDIIWDSKTKRQFRYLVIVIVSLWFFNVFSVFIQDGENTLRLVTLLYLIYSSLVAFVLTKSKIELLPIKLTFYAIAAYFIYLIVFLQVLVDEEIFKFSAGGMMPSILLSIAIPVQLFDLRWNKRIDLLPPIIIIIISVYSISRTSLICSLLYLLFNILMISFGNKKYRILGYLFFVVVIIVAYKAILQSLDDISTLEIYTKFERNGMDSSSRDDIWKAYFNELDFFTFFFGRNVDKTHTILGLSNTHNSFVQLHSQIGVLSIVYLVYFLKVCLFYIRENIYSFGLLLILILRCSFDTLFFFNIYDFAILVFLLGYKNQYNQKDDILKLSII